MKPMVVQYVPDGHKTKKELVTLGFELSQILGYVTTPDGDVLRGKNMSYEISDDILNFYIDYDFYIKSVIEEDAMERLDSEVTTRYE